MARRLDRVLGQSQHATLCRRRLWKRGPSHGAHRHRRAGGPVRRDVDTEQPDPLNPGWLERLKIPKGSYLSPDILDLEARRLWPRVWQMACRTEEIPNHGDFIVYDIMDESVIVLQ